MFEAIFMWILVPRQAVYMRILLQYIKRTRLCHANNKSPANIKDELLVRSLPCYLLSGLVLLPKRQWIGIERNFPAEVVLSKTDVYCIKPAWHTDPYAWAQSSENCVTRSRTSYSQGVSYPGAIFEEATQERDLSAAISIIDRGKVRLHNNWRVSYDKDTRGNKAIWLLRKDKETRDGGVG